MPFYQRYGRLFGLLYIGAGIAFVVHFVNVYTNQKSVEEVFVIITPFLILYGLAVLINPRLMMTRNDFRKALPGDKIVYYVILAVGIGLGFLLRFTIFAGWK